MLVLHLFNSQHSRSTWVSWYQNGVLYWSKGRWMKVAVPPSGILKCVHIVYMWLHSDHHHWHIQPTLSFYRSDTQLTVLKHQKLYIFNKKIKYDTKL